MYFRFPQFFVFETRAVNSLLLVVPVVYAIDVSHFGRCGPQYNLTCLGSKFGKARFNTTQIALIGTDSSVPSQETLASDTATVAQHLHIPAKAVSPAMEHAQTRTLLH
jgi:hypothetical protein